MENDIEVVEQGKYILVKVPLYIPKILYEQGAVEIMAKEDGWKETATSDEGVEIPNPITPLAFNVKKIQQDVKEKFRAITKRKVNEEADKNFDSLFDN